MYERILVPTDGSECADAAVEHAIDLASKYDAEVHVLYVVDVRVSGQGEWALDSESVYAAGRDHGEAVVETVADRIRKAGIDTVPAVRTGMPDTEIRDYADEEGCDLLVMGTHGRTGLDRYLIGSVAERIVRTSDVPVMTVRADESD